MKIKISKKDIPKTIQVFQEYGKKVRQYARSILSQPRPPHGSNRNATGTLYDSIDYDVNFSQGTVSVGMEIKPPADEYWAFVESGVAGRDTTFPNVGKNNELFDLPDFQFKKKNIAKGVVEGWLTKKGLSVKDMKSASFLIGRSIASRGLPWTGFLSQPIITQNQNLTNEIQDAFGEDLMNKLDYTVKAK